MTMGRALACAAALVLAACATARAPAGDAAPAAAAVPPKTLTGTRWAGVMEEPADPHVTPRIEFIGEGRMSGFTGCNMFSGNWSMEGAAVRVGKAAVTKKLCFGPAHDIEKRFLAAMQEGSHGTRSGNKLVFVAPAGDRFEFEPAADGS